MCFTCIPYSRVRIAKEDILCWKELSGNKSGIVSNNLALTYCVGKIVNAQDKLGQHIEKFRKINGVYIGAHINEGIHSYKHYSTRSLSGMFFRTPFVIPKGTQYYENSTQYVSLKIKRIPVGDARKMLNMQRRSKLYE